MHMGNLTLTILFIFAVSTANAQEQKKRLDAIPQQSSAEVQSTMQYDIPMPQHVAMPYIWRFDIPVQTSGTAGNVALLDSTTYKYQPLNLPFVISNSSRGYIGLMDVQSVSGSVRHDFGRLALSGGLMANRYIYYGNTVSQYGVSGQLTYSINPNVSATLFGEYYTTNPFISMAAYPYIPTTKYGGYMTVKSNRFFIDLGVEQRYNTINRSMETVPIVTPGFKVSKKLVIGLPLGDFAKYLIMDSAPKKQRPMAPPKQH